MYNGAEKTSYLMTRRGVLSGGAAMITAGAALSGVALVLFWTVVTSLSRGAWIALAFGVLVMRMTLHVFPRWLVFMTPAV